MRDEYDFSEGKRGAVIAPPDIARVTRDAAPRVHAETARDAAWNTVAATREAEAAAAGPAAWLPAEDVLARLRDKLR